MSALRFAAMLMGASSGPPPPSEYATYNPSDKSTDAVLSNANLTVTSSSSWQSIRATMGKDAGKWYCEFTVEGSYAMVGLADLTSAMINNYFAAYANSAAIYQDPSSGGYYAAGTVSTFGTAPANHVSNDVYGIAFDADAKKAWFRKNGTWTYGDPVAGTDPAMTWASATIYPAVSPYTSPQSWVHANFGQSAFAHAVPSGFNAGVYI